MLMHTLILNYSKLKFVVAYLADWRNCRLGFLKANTMVFVKGAETSWAELGEIVGALSRVHKQQELRQQGR